MNSVDFVLFGATGDLAMKKIFRALYGVFLESELQIIATSHRNIDTEGFLKLLREKSGLANLNDYDRFERAVRYVKIDLENSEDYKKLHDFLVPDSKKIFYLSIAPKFFVNACASLAKIGLNESSSVVVEKPLGYDLKSSQEINESIGAFFKEEKIYRIDHYLGKEGVMALLSFRFSHPEIDSLLSKRSVKNIQISVLEHIGIEQRGVFYDATGAMRDMLQNHMMQMLSFFLMDACDLSDDVRVRVNKTCALESLQSLDFKNDALYAQYTRNGEIRGYKEEGNVDINSHTESFVALRLESSAPRWHGVKIYMRHGKRMKESVVKVTASLKDDADISSAAKSLLALGASERESQTDVANLTFEIQPKARIVLEGRGSIYELALESSVFPYQKLISSVTKSNRSYFVHKDELYLSWSYLDALIHAKKPIFTYPACDDMPKEAYTLIEQDGNSWI